jgi:hypothetical protein
VSDQVDVRTYGGWRRSRSVGIGSLDTRQSAAVALGALIPLLLYAIGAWQPAVLVVLVDVVVLPLLMIRRGGVLLLDAALAAARWRRAHRRGQSAYRGGVLATLPDAWDLPGLLAPTTLLSAQLPTRPAGRVGVVWNRRTGAMAATALLTPGGALLADAETVQRHVAGWGELLASLADDEAIRSVAVTVELRPEPGEQLAEHLRTRVPDGAPALAREVLTQLGEHAPQLTARTDTRLTLTLTPPSRGQGQQEALAAGCADVVRALDALALPGAGADVARAATAEDLATIMRCAFDPGAATAPPEAFEGLLWGESGPQGADEWPDRYEHDGYVSSSFVLLQAPRQRVSHTVLLPLLSPGRYPRRVTLVCRTLSHHEAGQVLQREVAAGQAREEYRRRTKRDATARDRADAERAERAAREEAAGAGLVQFGLYVTVTCTDPAELEDACAEVAKAAGRARLKLRPARHAQAAVFAAGLPSAIYLPTA